MRQTWTIRAAAVSARAVAAGCAPAPNRLSTFLECGRSPTRSPHADNYRVLLWTSTRIVPEGGGTRVETSVAATAQARDVGADPLSCHSLGVLERRVVELLRDRLPGGADG